MKQDNQSAKKLLDIRHRPNGGVVINRYPFETVFNNDEWEEFVSYCTSHSSAPTERDKVLKVMRPQVLYFALRMEEKLRKHDKDRGSRGWVGYTQSEEQEYLFRRLVDEVKELKEDIIRAGACGEPLVRGSSENIDVGNIAMMLYTAYYGDESAISMIDFLMHELRPPTPEAHR